MGSARSVGRANAPMLIRDAAARAGVSLPNRGSFGDQKAKNDKGQNRVWPKALILLVPVTGIELVTYCLQGSCSTD